MTTNTITAPPPAAAVHRPRPSLAVIRKKCLDCCAYAPARVRNCWARDCPLFPGRMGYGAPAGWSRRKAIRLFCGWCTCDQPTEIRLCPADDCPLYPFRGYCRPARMPGNAEKGQPDGLSARLDCKTDPEAVPDEHEAEKVVSAEVGP